MHKIRRGLGSPLFYFTNQTENGYMNIEKRVTELVEEKLADRPDLFIVSINFLSNGKLMILLDGDNGIGIDDCAKVSRHVGFHLEEENTIDTAYNLEVSSPGIDMPLTLPRQYSKNIGRQLSVKTTAGTKREGKLLAADENTVTIEESIKEKGKKAQLVESIIPLNEISETKVLISFK